MTQTAVDQLIEEIEKRMILIHFETNKPTREVMILNLPMDLERFKEMEKVKLEDAWVEGVKNWNPSKTFEQYYQETYGGNK
jgi:hypothetical protein